MRHWHLLSVISAMNLVRFSPAPYSVSSDLGKLEASRHLSSGIDWAMAGAATVLATTAAPPPIPAVRKNLRRCMLFTPRNVFLFVGIPPGGISLPCPHGARKEKAPPKRGFSSRPKGPFGA